VIDPQLSEAIKGYEAALLPLALRLAGRNGAEVDDLIQEGRISLWGPLAEGTTPSLDICFFRMKMWCRHLIPQNPGPYEEMDLLVGERFDGR
jgi:hypothetical protein